MRRACLQCFCAAVRPRTSLFGLTPSMAKVVFEPACSHFQDCRLAATKWERWSRRRPSSPKKNIPAPEQRRWWPKPQVRCDRRLKAVLASCELQFLASTSRRRSHSRWPMHPALIRSPRVPKRRRAGTRSPKGRHANEASGTPSRGRLVGDAKPAASAHAQLTATGGSESVR